MATNQQKKLPLILRQRARIMERLNSPVFLSKRRKAIKRGKDILTAISRVLTDLGSNTYFLLTLALTVFVMYSHVNDTTNGPLHTFIEKLVSDDSTKGIGEYLKKNINGIVGVLIFMPTIFAVPKSQRLFVAVMTIAWSLLFVPYSILEYAIQSFVTLLYFRLNKPTHRFIVVAVGIATMYFGTKSVFPRVASKQPA